MGRPMPDELRANLRAKQHPARAVVCPHCGAAERKPCRNLVRAHSRVRPDPHPSRIAAWAVATAVCPACQVPPGTPCHTAGRPLHDGAVHPQRTSEAERSAA
jgi:hypothetical protein